MLVLLYTIETFVKKGITAKCTTLFHNHNLTIPEYIGISDKIKERSNSGKCVWSVSLVYYWRESNFWEWR